MRYHEFDTVVLKVGPKDILAVQLMPRKAHSSGRSAFPVTAPPGSPANFTGASTLVSVQSNFVLQRSNV